MLHRVQCMTSHLCLIKFYSNLILIETQNILNKYHGRHLLVAEPEEHLLWLLTYDSEEDCISGVSFVGSPIKCVRKIFRKTNISNPWYAHVRVRIRGLKMLVFQKILRTYLMDGPCCDNHPRSKLYITKFLPPHIQKY